MNRVIAQSQLIVRAGDAHSDQPRTAQRPGNGQGQNPAHGRVLGRIRGDRPVEGRTADRHQDASKTEAAPSDAESFATHLQRYESGATEQTAGASDRGPAAIDDAGVAADPRTRSDADAEAAHSGTRTLATELERNASGATGQTAAAIDEAGVAVDPGTGSVVEAEAGEGENAFGTATTTRGDGTVAGGTSDGDDDSAASVTTSGTDGPPVPEPKRALRAPTPPTAPQPDIGPSVEYSLASLGQDRPITIDQITQLLLQIDPTLAARGMVKGVKPREVSSAEAFGVHSTPEPVGAGDEIRGESSAEWQAAATQNEVDSGEKIIYSSLANTRLNTDLGIDIEGLIEPGREPAKPETAGSISARAMSGEGASRGVREVPGTASKSIWTLSVMPATAAHVGAGSFQRPSAGTAGGAANSAADFVVGPSAAATVGGPSGGSASTGEQTQEDPADDRSSTNASITGIQPRGELSLPGEVSIRPAVTGETQRGNEPARQELLAAQIDRALAASVERSVASRSSGGSHETVLQLSPRVLGRIRIAVQVESNKASVRMRVENAEARQLLTESLPSLVASLKQRGIEVESVQIRESEAEAIAAEQPSRGAESPREAAGWNPKRLERSSARIARYGAEATEGADVIVSLRLDALA